ncbi:hypothetical protein F0562_026981 [Nyssa sinensis]|uniref:Uncharacterized protein n=1 Tax=Nyssa sinensis TaxID=561372 RepID=A0A5J5B669_9ASTE|nr:hypothetical protein F0562_026981 [Nyssa sinensis]
MMICYTWLRGLAHCKCSPYIVHTHTKRKTSDSHPFTVFLPSSSLSIGVSIVVDRQTLALFREGLRVCNL